MSSSSSSSGQRRLSRWGLTDERTQTNKPWRLWPAVSWFVFGMYPGSRWTRAGRAPLEGGLAGCKPARFFLGPRTGNCQGRPLTAGSARCISKASVIPAASE
jgi:hypothetical protein